MSAAVDIQTSKAFNVISVPVQAVTTREDTTSYGVKEQKEKKESVTEENSKTKEKEAKVVEYVFIIKNDIALLTPVITGIQDNNYIEIKKGLNAQDEIITGPYKVVSKTLKNKTPIEKVDKDDLFDEKEE
jgi:HlyD family secretion protein